jgi:hypothetical protein
VKALLADPSFLALRDSWRLARFLANNWGQLTEPQVQELRPALVAAFDQFQDWLGAFVVAEVLGERYADDAALETLMRLGRTAKGPARTLAAHGLEKLATTRPEGPDRERAIAGLKTFAASGPDELRKEAAESLGRLKR